MSVIITIDGPAGSGKSTTARLVAKALDFLYINSGAFYRCITLAALKEGISLDDAGNLEALVNQLNIELTQGDEGNRVFLNGREVTDELNAPEVSERVSDIAKNPAVRRLVTQELRALVQGRPVVVEGRDIGTHVFPEAYLKVYLEASLEERARRRLHELEDRGYDVSLAEVKAELAKRDGIDSSRETAPLRRAEDAISVDTTNLSVEEQVDRIVRKFHEKQKTTNLISNPNHV